MQQKSRQSAHSQHPSFRRDHLDIKPSDLLPDPHLSFSVMLSALSHLLLSRLALRFSSTVLPVSPPPNYHLSCPHARRVFPRALFWTPSPNPQFLSPPQDALFIRKFWTRNCRPTQVWVGCWGWWWRMAPVDVWDTNEGGPQRVTPVGSILEDRSVHPCTVPPRESICLCLSVIWVPRPITGFNLEEWMNECPGAMTRQTGFRGVSWVDLVPVGWNSGTWTKGKLWS